MKITSNMLKNIFFTSIVLLLFFNLLIYPKHPHFYCETFFGFWAVFGLISSLVLGRVAKWIAHSFLNRSEDFYNSKKLPYLN